MKLGIAEILDLVKKEKAQASKVKILQEHDHPVLRNLLKITYHQDSEWLLPKTNPPYKAMDKSMDLQGRLLQENRRMYLFLRGGNDNLTDLRRETLFIQILESVDPDDAKLLCEMKNKKIKGVSANVVSQAYPGLLDANV